MDPTCSFRKALLRRLLEVVGLAAIASPVLHAGCGNVVVDGDASGNGVGGSGSSTGALGGGIPVSGSGIFPDGGECVGSASSSASTGTGDPSVVAVTECIAPQPKGCPSQYDADQYIVPTDCAYLVQVECGPVMVGGQCCYVAKEQLHGCVGRPFFAGGEARTAALVLLGVNDDRGWSEVVAAPSLLGLDAATRAALASAWTRDALFEHASVASFGRFAMDLLAVGAPADLIAQAHRAAIDEVRHARLCFGLAEAYGGEAVAPSAFPFGGHVEVTTDLASLAAATAREGCIGETLAALLAAEQRDLATDPAVRRALTLIADDEARHAELAWRTVAWALAEGGAPVRAAVLEVFGNAARHVSFGAGAVAIDPAIAAAHGRLGAQRTRQATVRAFAEVIMPCEAVLFAQPHPRAQGRIAEERGPQTTRSPS